MSDQDIFTNTDKKDDTNNGDPVSSSDNQFADKLNLIVDDTGKPKYETVDKALEALAHSQAHIKTLEGERSTSEERERLMREELEKRRTVEDFVNKLSPEPKPNTEQKTPEVGVGLDEAKVAELISNSLSQKEKADAEANNVNFVVNTLTEKFGDSAQAEVAKVAKDNGMTTKELQEMSALRPQLVLNLFGEKTSKPQSTTPSHSSTPKEVTQDNEGKNNLLRGGITSKELTTGWNAIGKDVKNKYGITE